MTSPSWARRVDQIESFKVMDLLQRAKTLEASGHDVIHMEIGEPDFTTAPSIVEAGQQALATGKTQYTPAPGIPALREAISQHYRQSYGLEIPASRIIVTAGGSGGLMLLSALLANPGDSWMMADPAYPCNRQFLRVVGAQAKMVATKPEEGFVLTPEQVDKHWTAEVTGLLLASPANPTGYVMSQQELAAISEVVSAKGGHFIVDEIYHGLSYGQEAPTALSVNDQAFVINSFSKYFGMTGWRLGWIVAPEWAVEPLERLAQNLFISAPSIAQYAALACFETETRLVLEERRAAFAKRRDFLLPALRELGFNVPFEPQGAFYIYADVSAITPDSYRFCFDLLEAEGVAITPGADFGHASPERYIRFAYTTSLERLQEAVSRIARFIEAGT
ncbi:pyridoxal phosphate-dependent aminotransferase [Pokkaliibacter sp. CJK22405]|uniref:pyridoxal phosphate-dependent aminotransferase n=1 Tax=Pokkaliibacter sp. CJK22405 TaxID=3384615 RepID=UPI0039855AC1